MKKLFTLFMAIVVAASMNALPLNLKTEKTQGISKHQTEQSIKKQQRMEQLTQTSYVMESRQAVPADQVVKKAPAKAGKKVAAATMEDIEFVELNYSSFAMGPEYSEDTESWFVGLQTLDETQPEYGTMIQLDWVAPKDDYTGTFTTEDFTPDYTWALTNYCYGYIVFDSISMTISTQKGEHTETIVLDAVLIGSDGWENYAFKVHAEHVNITPSEQIEVPMLNATIETTENGFVLSTNESDVELVLPVQALEIMGAYTLDNIDLEASKFVYKGQSITPLLLDLVVRVAAVPEVGYAYESELMIIGDDYKQYNMYLITPLPEPTDTVEIACVNLQLTADGMSVYFIATNAMYEVSGVWNAEEIAAGTYTDGTTNIFNQETYDYLTAWGSEIVVSGSEEEGWVLDIEALCPDNKIYKANLKFYVPTPTDTIVVAFENSAKARFYPDMGNDIQLFNENEQYYAALNVAEVELGSSFTNDDLFPMFSGVEVNVDGEYLPIDYAYAQNGLLSQVGDTTKMYAEYLTFDGKLYEVHLWHVAPTPTDTVEVTYESAEFINNMDYSGTYSLLAYGPDSLTAMVISLYAYSEDEIAGTFVNDGKFGLFGEGQYEFDAANTYYGVYNADFETYDLVYAEKGEVVVTVDEEKNITLTGHVICENAVQYNVTMKSKIQRPHLDFDSPDTPVDRIFTAQDSATVVNLVDDASMIYFSVQSIEHGDVFDFYMIVEAADPDIVLPVGMYEINDSGEYNTVLAGQGVDMWMGMMTPGFYGFVDAEGYILEPMYFLVGGTVEVRKNDDGSLYVEINAFNSYDVPVHIIYDASATGVEDIQVENIIDTKKMIIDGQLVIIRNGKIYDAVGAQVK
jgi:hypothetical protein